MKTTNACPKCDSTDIYKSDSNTSRNHYHGLTELSGITPTIYICRACGYCEEYFKPRDLKRLK